MHEYVIHIYAYKKSTRVSSCMHAHTYTYIDIHASTCSTYLCIQEEQSRLQLHACTYMYMHTYHKQIHVVHVYACNSSTRVSGACMHVHIHPCMNMWMYMYAYACIYTHKHVNEHVLYVIYTCTYNVHVYMTLVHTCTSEYTCCMYILECVLLL